MRRLVPYSLVALVPFVATFAVVIAAVSVGSLAGLLVVGAVLELAGIGLVAWDVADARHQRVSLSRRDQLVQVSPAVSESRAMDPVVTGGGTPPAPPLEERVASLERDIAALRTQLDAEAEHRVQGFRDLTDRFSDWIAEVRREVFDLEQRLRPIIGEVAAGSIRRRALGVALFAIGLVTQTAANLLAL